MVKNNRIPVLSDDDIIFLKELLVSQLLRMGTKGELRYDIAKAQRGLVELGFPITEAFLENLILAYCRTIEKSHDNVLSMEVDHPSSGILLVTFTIRLFDKEKLPEVNPELIQHVAVSTGEWQKAPRKPVKD